MNQKKVPHKINLIKPLIGLADHQFKILYSDVFDVYCEYSPTLLTHTNLLQRKIEFIRSVIQQSMFILFSSEAETLCESRDAWTYAIYICSLLCGTESHSNEPEPKDIQRLPKLMTPATTSWLKTHGCYESIHELFQKKEPSRFTELFQIEKKKNAQKEVNPQKRSYNDINQIRTTQKELLEKFIRWVDYHLKKDNPRISKQISITPEGIYLQSPLIFELFEQETLMSSKFAQRAIKKSPQFLRSKEGNFIHQHRFSDRTESCLLFRM